MRQKIRILLTVPHLHSTHSPYREMIAIVRHLPKDEFDLTVCALRKSQNDNAVPLLNEHGIPWLVARFRPRGKTLRQVFESIKDQKTIDQKGPFDIQHSLDFTSSPFEAYMARIKRRQYIFNQRNMNEGGKTFLLRLKVRAASKVIAISDHIVKFMQDHKVKDSQLVKIYNGIDVQDIADSDAAIDALPFKRLVLSVGHVERRKRHEDAIRAFAMISSRSNGVQLGIAGGIHDQKYYDELLGIIRELNLGDRVSFLGIRQDILGLMRKADALILCSESEGVPWVLLEAMAVGLPIVASDIDGTNEAVQNGMNGILVPLANVNAYAQALSLMLNDSTVRGTFAENSKKLLDERFSATVMVTNLASIYRELGNSRKRAS